MPVNQHHRADIFGAVSTGDFAVGGVGDGRKWPFGQVEDSHFGLNTFQDIFCFCNEFKHTWNNFWLRLVTLRSHRYFIIFLI